MSSSGVVSKKLKFKGDKPKKKKRTHSSRHEEDEIEALAAADPTGELRVQRKSQKGQRPIEEKLRL